MNAAWGGISEENEISICVSAEHKTTKNILARNVWQKFDFQNRRRGWLRLRGNTLSHRTRKIDTTPLITHIFPLTQIEEAYELFEHKRDGVIKIAITL